MKLFQTEEESVVAIVDIGDGSIGGSLVRLNRAGPPDIFMSVRAPLKMQTARTEETLLSEIWRELPPLLETLRASSARLVDPRTSRPLSRNVTHILLVLSTPWIRVTGIRTLRFSRETPFLVTEELLEKMLADEMRIGREEEGEEGFVIIERAVVGLRLNGYQVVTMPSSPVTTAEVTFFTASAREDVLEHLIELTEERFPGLPRSFHSAPLSAFHGVASLYPSLLSYLFIAVGSEVTEVLHVEEVVPVAFSSFPVGRNLLFRTLEANSLPLHEALSALVLSREESSRFNTTLSETLRHVEKEWRDRFRESLSALIPTGSFPSTILVTADMNVQSFFADAVRAEDFLTMARGSEPLVQALLPGEFGAAVLLREGPPDPVVFLTTLFADARFDARKTLGLLSTKIPLGIPSRVTLKA